MLTKLSPYFQVLRPAFVKLYVPVSLFLGAILGIKVFWGVPFSQLTRDPISLGGLNPIFGIVSNVGILLWCAATTICFFCATLVKDAIAARFLLVSGILSFFLMIDDFFVIHESLRDYFGVPENAVYIFYLIYLIFYFIIFGKFILNKNVALLVLAFGFLGTSATIDIFQKLIRYDVPGYFFVEDGLKFLGIASWAGFFVTTAFTHIEQSFSSEMTTTVGDG